MGYKPDNWILSDYERTFTSHGSIDVYYPKIIMQKYLRESLLEDLVEMFGVEYTHQIITLLDKRFKE